ARMWLSQAQLRGTTGFCDTRLGDYVPTSRCTGEYAHVSEYASLKSRSRPCRSQNLRKAFPQVPVYAPHLLNRGLLISPDKGIAQLSKDTVYSAIVEVYICATEITQRFCEPKTLGLEYKPTMGS